MSRNDQLDGIPESTITLLIALWAMQEAAQSLAATAGRLARVIAKQGPRPETSTGVHGAPCGSFDFRTLAPDVARDEPDEILTHKMEPQDNASLHDDPPSRPA